MKRAIPFLGAGLVVLGTAGAHAHAPAQATGIWWSDENTASPVPRVFVRTNRGLVVGDRDGQFRLLCNEALRVSAAEEPPLVVGRAGVLIATYGGGLLSAAPDLCSFERRALPIASGRVLDLAASADGARFLALTAPTETEPGAVLDSDDAGRTWSPGASTEGFGSSLRVAPSNPSRVYVAQQRLTESDSNLDLDVSDNGGKTFATRPVALAEDEVRGFVAAVGARDPDLVFVTTIRGNPLFEARVLMSRDAGQSFTTAFHGVGPLSVTTDANDATVFVGGADGIYGSQDGGETFVKLPYAISNIGCLEVHAEALFACGFAHNQFGVFRSTDAGTTFSPYLLFSTVRDGVACGANSEVQLACAGSLEHWRSELPPEEPPVVTTPANTAPDTPVTALARDGCALAPLRARADSAWWIALGAAFGAWAALRRRRLELH